MRKTSPRLIVATCLVVFLTGFGGDSFSQEAKRDTLVGDDLHYLGYVMLSGDTSAWVNMKSDDFYHLSKAMFFRAPKVLSYIKNDDLYFLGAALIYGDDSELEKIVQDDFYYLGKAIFSKQISVLENIKSDDVYYLGKGLIKKDANYLDQMSTQTKK
ncbi:MAG: hypothetical protein ACPGU4_11810 [Flavobacteriales bacterium]